jgi:hypothetical protein
MHLGNRGAPNKIRCFEHAGKSCISVQNETYERLSTRSTDSCRKRRL